MKENPLFNNDAHHLLVNSYIFKKGLYSLSFKERVSMDLGNTTFQTKPQKELYELSDEEIQSKFDTIKAPWWNSIYEKRIKNNRKFLSILNILFNAKYYGIKTFILLYKVIKAKKTEFK